MIKNDKMAKTDKNLREFSSALRRTPDLGHMVEAIRMKLHRNTHRVTGRVGENFHPDAFFCIGYK